ncbi:MAG: 5'-3' exonuclease H3TH domain-containing protein [Promethearchaeota archaeon]
MITSYGKKYLARQLSLGKELLWPNILRESKQLIGALGIPYIEFPASAESQCAQLVKNKIAYYSNSQDYDSLLFGCPRVIQNLSKSMKRKVQGKWKYKKIDPMIIFLSDNLKRLKINQFQLIDLAILIGTDYFPGVKGIGPKTALKLLTKYSSLERVILNEKSNYDFTLLTPKLLKNIRKILLLPEVNQSIGTLCWNPPNKGQLIDLLCRDHHLSLERVNNNVGKVIKNYYACRKFFKTKNNNSSLVQTTLDVTNH